jgi:hypothetical protein
LLTAKSFLFSGILLTEIFFSQCCFATTDQSLPVTTIETRSLLEQLVSSRPAIGPSSSVSTPVAYGVGWGTVLLGVAAQDGTQYTHRPFGEYAVGFGLGDPDRFVALTTVVTMGGVDEVVRDGNVNFQISRNLNSNGAALAFGVENVAPWGADKRNKMNVYFVGTRAAVLPVTKIFHMNIITSLGIGNSRFVHNYEVHKDESGIYRPFASIGCQILPQAALIFDYVGLTFNAGISIVPFLKYPLVMSLTAVDLTNRGGSHIPVAGSIGYSYNF